MVQIVQIKQSETLTKGTIHKFASHRKQGSVWGLVTNAKLLTNPVRLVVGASREGADF